LPCVQPFNGVQLSALLQNYGKSQSSNLCRRSQQNIWKFLIARKKHLKKAELNPGSKKNCLRQGYETFPHPVVGKGVDRPRRQGDRRQDGRCVSAWNKDPVFGVTGIQSGPRGLRAYARSLECLSQTVYESAFSNRPIRSLTWRCTHPFCSLASCHRLQIAS
jgi:hypothetical protein